MIAKITLVTQYSKGQPLPDYDLSLTHRVVYAHSMQDALEWVLSLPQYHGASVENDGRIIFVDSPWVERPEADVVADRADGEARGEASHTREAAIISGCETVM